MKRIIIGGALFILMMIVVGFGISTFAADDQTVMYKYCTENYNSTDECIRAELFPQEEGQILTVPQMVVIANDAETMGELEAEVGVFGEIYTESVVANPIIDYTIMFSNATTIFTKETHKNYVTATDSKGEIVGRLGLEPRVADLEGYAYQEHLENKRIQTCLANSIDYKTYKECVTKTVIKP